MDIFLVNEDHEGSKGLMGKLSGPHESGAVIPLTGAEYDAYINGAVRHMAAAKPEENSGVSILGIDRSADYVIICDPFKASIDDLLRLRESMRGGSVEIIRVKG